MSTVPPQQNTAPLPSAGSPTTPTPNHLDTAPAPVNATTATSRPSSSGNSTTSSEEVVVVEQGGVEVVLSARKKEEKATTGRKEKSAKASTPVPPVTIPRPKSTKAAKGKGLAATVASGNALVERINRLLASSVGKDKTMSVMGYTLVFISANLQILARARAKAHATNSTVFPAALSKFITFPRAREASNLVAVAVRMKAFASLISDVRMFMRLWGLLGIYEWMVSTIRDPPKDGTLRRIAILQVGLNIVYQLLENVAYLGQHKILPIGTKRQDLYYVWSSRLWMTTVFLDFWRLKRERDLELQGTDKKAEDEEDQTRWYDLVGVLKGEGSRNAWLRQLWSNMAYGPMTMHYSFESLALSPLAVGILGSISGTIGLQKAWRSTP